MKSKDEIQNEALTIIKNRQLSGLEISMGVGKTLIGIKDQAFYYTDTSNYLVVVPRKVIITSWKEEMKKHDYEYLNEHVDFSTYRSLSKQKFDYDTIYLDECHSLKAGHNEWLKEYVKRGGRIIGLTGTYPVYSTSEKGKMCNFYCPKVYMYKTDDAIEDNILNSYQIIIHQLKLDSENNIDKEGIHGSFKTSELKQYQYWTNRVEQADSPKSKQICSIQRMKALQQFNSKMKYAKTLLDLQKDKTLIFANTQEQADNLCSYSYHSSNKDSEYNLTAFKKGHSLKLSAVEMVSEGTNIPGLKVGIITHAYANNRKAAQKIGRFLRLNPNDESTIHILCYADSVDKQWIIKALESFDKTKIKWQ